MKTKIIIFIFFTYIIIFTCFGQSLEKQIIHQALDLLENAVKLINEKGDLAIKQIGRPDGKFIDIKNSLYVFVYDQNCVILAHPFKPFLVGRSYKGKPDVKGKKFRDEIVENALTKGNGSLIYSYQRPGMNGIFQKKVFYKLAKFGEKKYIVCSGIYLNSNQ